MSCGHALLHRKTPCSSSVRLKAPCQELHGPTQRFNDTCAKCHPSFIMSEINQRYDQLQADLVSAMLKAENEEKGQELKRAVEQAHSLRGRELRSVGRLKWSGIVVWGPKGYEGEE
ncbi:uncharacterized protein L3040_006194 [Drepanopeziza brunnea f. sp. 'multigermtubi']|uniref:uncharacterized protein n=1 Tax=Drepanopeziza brunnea f. sp. 'multigermtubi' TaxID=698441 RepID=UPI00239BE7BB|nr:hypothetical protein L3040_006194 [Drepanopeziza brunnea f. sp. 'multigermtubi']